MTKNINFLRYKWTLRPKNYIYFFGKKIDHRPGIRSNFFEKNYSRLYARTQKNDCLCLDLESNNWN
jgi:hypothetical protein